MAPATGGNNPASVIAQARKQLEAGNTAAALSTARLISGKDDAAPDALIEVADLLVQAGAAPEGFAAYLTAGRRYLDQGDNDSARLSFDAARDLDAKNIDPLFELARVDVAEGKKHDALEKFAEVLRKSNFTHVPALFEAASVYEADGQYDQAIHAFKRITERDKSNYQAYKHLAALHLQKHMLSDAANYYAFAAEAARKALAFEEARECAAEALEIDSSNAKARQVFAEVEKVDSSRARRTATASSAAPAPPPAKAVPKAAPSASTSTATPRPAAAARAATPSVNKPPAEEPAQEETETFSMPDAELDVAMLEQQSRASAELAQVTTAVAQAYRKRLAIEEQIKVAQAALAQLQSEREDAETNLSSLQNQLSEVGKAKAAEDAALKTLVTKLERARAGLESLTALNESLREAEAKSNAVGDSVEKARGELSAAKWRAEKVKSDAASVEQTMTELQTDVAEARKSAETALTQLSGVLERSRKVNASASLVASKIAEVETALIHVEENRAEADEARKDIAALAEIIEQKRTETDAAIAHAEQLREERQYQLEAIQANLSATEAKAVEIRRGEPAAATAPPPAAPPRPAAPTSTRVSVPETPASSKALSDIEALIKKGRREEALRTAKAQAKAQPNAGAFLLSVGDQLRTAGDTALAAQAFEAALEVDKRSQRGRYELGTSYRDLGRPDEALIVLDQVDPKSDLAMLSQIAAGQCLRQLGRTEEAAARFSQALEIPGHPESHYHEALYNLADLQTAAGDPESLELALWSLEEIASADPKFRDVKTKIGVIKTRLASGTAAAGTEKSRGTR